MRVCKSKALCFTTATVAVASCAAVIAGAAIGSQPVLYSAAAGLFLATVFNFATTRQRRIEGDCNPVQTEVRSASNQKQPAVPA